MKKINKALLAIVAFLLINAVILYFALPQVFSQKLKAYKGNNNLAWSKPLYDSQKRLLSLSLTMMVQRCLT